MKRYKIVFIFLLFLPILILISSCNNSSLEVVNSSSTGIVTPSESSNITQSTVDTEYNEAKERYEKLLKHKEQLITELNYFNSMLTSVNDKIALIKQQITALDNDIRNTYSMFSYLENTVLKSSVMVTHKSYIESGSWFLPDEYLGGGFGSGFIIKKTAQYYYILTNNHVIYPKENSTLEEIFVYDYDLNEYKGTLICNDASYDMAVVRITINSSNPTLTPMSLADKDPLKGDTVIAIGQPKGQLNSIGIGQVLNYAKVNFEEESSKVKYDVIRHNAYMLSGNSGGMLININYQVVGINSWGLLSDNYDLHIGKSSPVTKIKEFLNKYSI